MILDINTIKKIDNNEIYSLLKSIFDEVHQEFVYLNISETNFNEIALNIIEHSKNNYNGKNKYENYVERLLRNKLLEITYNYINNSDTAYNIIDNYINLNSVNINSYNKAIMALKKIVKFLTDNNYILEPDILLKLVKNNDNLTITLKTIINEINTNKNCLKNEIFKDEIVKLIVECYSESKGITINVLSAEVENNNDNQENNTINNDYVDEDIVKTYLKEMGQVPLLTSKEEHQLALRVKNGDKKAKDKFIEANLRLVVSIAKRYTSKGVALIDLIQEGNIGLMTAVDRYDPNMGYKFSTYATWWIRQTITRTVLEKKSIIHIPVHKAEEIMKMFRARNKLYDEYNREPTYDEIANEINTTYDNVKDLCSIALEPVSTNELVGEDGEEELENFIPSETNTEDAAMQGIIPIVVNEVLDECKLTDRERQIIKLRFGIGTPDNRTRTLEEVGQVFNITRERVRQVEAKVLRKLRNPKYTSKLAPLLGYDEDYVIDQKDGQKQTKKKNTISSYYTIPTYKTYDIQPKIKKRTPVNPYFDAIRY